jgi:beta-xylosidase
VTSTEITQPWRDTGRGDSERVADLLNRLTLEEKIGQLGSVWLNTDVDGDGVAPMQDDFAADRPPLEDLLGTGLGQVTRVFGTRPVPPADGARALAALQRRIVAGNRLGIPAMAHEECRLDRDDLPDAAGVGRVVRSGAGRRHGPGGR